MKLYESPPAEITHHPGHPGHTLKLVTTDGSPFLCDGCHEPGDGKVRAWYKCESGCAHYDLHICCALAAEQGTLEIPLLPNRKFEFLLEPTPPVDKTLCDACGERARGFVYHSNKGDLDLHPCCATLSDIVDEDGRVIINLCKEAKKTCVICGCKGEKTWAYRWKDGSSSEYVHVACMKKTTLKTWDQRYKVIRAGGGMVEASVSIMKDMMLQKKCSNTGSSSWFERITMIVEAIGSIIVAVITGNPVAMITAIAKPISAALRGLSDRSR